MRQITIDKEECVDCGACEGVCAMVNFVGLPSILDQRVAEVCIECQDCAAMCRQSAVKVGDLPDPEPLGELPSVAQGLALFTGGRRSVRTFKNKPIREEHWDKILQVLDQRAVGHNARHHRVKIVQSEKLLKDLSAFGMTFWEWTAHGLNTPILNVGLKKLLGKHTAKVFSQLAPFIPETRALYDRGGDPVLFNAPALLFFMGPKDEMMAPKESVMAAQTVASFAPVLGLGTIWAGIIMAGFNIPILKPWSNKLVEIPKGFSLDCVLAIGHPKWKPYGIPHRKRSKIEWL